MAKSASKNKASRGKAKPASGKSVAKAKRPAPKTKATKAAKPKSAVGKLMSKVLTKVKAAVKAKPAKAKSAAKPAPKAKVKAKVVAKPKPAAKPAPKVAPKPAPKAKPVVAPKPVHPAPKAAPTPATKSAMPAKPATATKAQGKSNLSGYVPMVASPRPSGRVAVAVTKPIAKPKRRSESYNAEGKKTPRQPVDLPAGYKPGKPGAKESYMNDFQLEYFRRKLLTWREELVEESKQTIDNLREEVRDVGDEAERATRETENSLELRTRDRYRKLIGKIDKALRRIEDGEYGYCEETGEEIGLDRLEARPIATLCLDAQERWEHRQRQMGD